MATSTVPDEEPNERASAMPGLTPAVAFRAFDDENNSARLDSG
jgi:hypothetical protein